MINKAFTPKRSVCKVTFKIPADWADKKVSLVGDFNEWDPSANKLERKNGYWETTIRLKPETETKFRYFLDDGRWANDDEADSYVGNSYGSEDSLLKIGK